MIVVIVDILTWLVVVEFDVEQVGVEQIVVASIVADVVVEA
jgi:hypothetical protein